MPVPRVRSPERRSVVLALDCDEAIVATESPAAGVPLQAAADIAGEECLGVVDAQAGALEERLAADATGDVRHDRPACGVNDHVAVVVQQMGRSCVGERRAVDVETLRDPERTAELTLDADVAIEVHRDAAAEVVVAEARTLRVLSPPEERAAAGNDRGLDEAR